MRKRSEIEKDGKRPEFLILEVLLDIRDAGKKEKKMRKQRKLKKEVRAK